MKVGELVYNINTPTPTLHMNLPPMAGSVGWVVSPGAEIRIILVSGLDTSYVAENNWRRIIVKNNGVLDGVMDCDALADAVNKENRNDLILVTRSRNGK